MKLKCLLFSLPAVCGLLTGCLSEDDFKSETGDDSTKLKIELFNEIRQVPVTRVNDEGFCNGDQVGIYVVNYSNDLPGILQNQGNQADNVRHTFDESANRWTPDYPIYFADKKTAVDIIGYYPFTSIDNVAKFSFEVQKDQSQEAADGKLGSYESSDFLWGKTEKIMPTTSRINVIFNHLLAGVQVELVEGTGFGDNEWAGLEKQVLVNNTIRKCEIDISSGQVGAVGEVPVTGIIPFKSNGSWRAVVVPQTVDANLALFSITVDGIPYIFRKDSAFEYISGKLHKFTIEVSKKSVGGLEFKILGQSITAWESEGFSHDGTAREYVVINNQVAGQLQSAIEADGKNYQKIKNLKVTGVVNASDFYFMRDEMPALQSINMKEVKIVKGKYGGGEDEIPEGAFSYKSSLVRFVFPDNLKKIGNSAFCKTNLSGSLIIPEGVVEIGSQAFGPAWAGGGTVPGLPLSGQLILPSTLKVIGSYAFAMCQGLTGNLYLPEGLEEIHDSAFKGCTGFTGELNIPDSVHLLGDDSMYGGAFINCSGFTGSLKIPTGLTKIGYDAFEGCSGLNGELILHDGITEIGPNAFRSCSFRYPIQLPKSLIVINDYAFAGCQFSGTLVLPEDLTVLGKYAFAWNNRMTGVVEIPKEITSIPEGLFNGCTQLEGVVLNKNIESIKSSAFYCCYQLNSIVSHAQTPPTVSGGAFDGVAKDNFAVEVPEESVNSYRYVTGWNEFKRITANRDFSISRSLFRTLNDSDSKTVVLRAKSGEAWTVSNCPEWVTVTPNSGVGKTEVVITTSEMMPSDVTNVTYEAMNGDGNYQNYSFMGRRGEVTFDLTGKDCKVTTVVEQYDYEYGDSDVITVQEATKGNGVNVVFMGDCFDAKDIYEGKYLDGINEAIGYYFDIEPYKTYKDYFNVYTVVGLSPDSGVGTVNTIRESRFGTQYSLNAGLAPDEQLCFEGACLAPINDDVARTLIVMIENSEEYGGVCYMWGDGSAIAICPMSRDLYPYDFRGLVQHEAGGHGFGKLGDEYIYHNAFIQACSCICCPHVLQFNANKANGWFDNLSLSGGMHEVPWAHMIFDPQFQNTVDIYEGGYMHTRGVFRSEPNSCMNNNIPYYSAISRESIVKRIKLYAGEGYSFEDFKANDVLTLTSGLDTKSHTFSGVDVIGYPSNKQYPPVYMGDKPSFRKGVSSQNK